MPTIEQARAWYADADTVHDFDHVLRVYRMAERIAQTEGADLTIVRMVDRNWTDRASTQVGRIIGPVPRENLVPFLHQRYDDFSVLGGGDD